MLLLQRPQGGHTPLDWAEEHSQEEAAGVLRRHGAKRGAGLPFFHWNPKKFHEKVSFHLFSFHIPCWKNEVTFHFMPSFHFISFHVVYKWIFMSINEVLREFENGIFSFSWDTIRDLEEGRRWKWVLRPTSSRDWGQTGSEDTDSFCCSRNWHCTTFSWSSSHGWWCADGLCYSFCGCKDAAGRRIGVCWWRRWGRWDKPTCSRCTRIFPSPSESLRIQHDKSAKLGYLPMTQ